MNLTRQLQLLLAVLPGVAACANPVGPTADAAVTVRAASVDAAITVAGTVTWLHFTVPVRFANTGPTPVSFVPCASSLESRAGSAWSSAWLPICTANGPSLNNIPPGETREVQIDVWAALAGPGAPVWGGEGLDRRLRYRAGYAFAGLRGHIPTVASNEFTLESAQ